MIRKIRLISNFLKSQPGKQTITMHILPYISRDKGNQTMKFGPIIGYNMRDIFLKKSYTKYDRKTIPRPFSKKTKLRISVDQQPNVLYSLLLLYAKLGYSYQDALKLSCRSLASTSCKAFLINKNWFPYLMICMIFEEKYFFCYILLSYQISLSNCLYFVRCLAIYVL